MEYFIIKNNMQQGPFTINGLKDFGVKPTDKVWKQGLAEWMYAVALPELEHLFGKNPPPITDSILAEEETQVQSTKLTNTAAICLLVYLGWEVLATVVFRLLSTINTSSNTYNYMAVGEGVISILLPAIFIFFINNKTTRVLLLIFTIIKIILLMAPVMMSFF